MERFVVTVFRRGPAGPWTAPDMDQRVPSVGHDADRYIARSSSSASISADHDPKWLIAENIMPDKTTAAQKPPIAMSRRCMRVYRRNARQTLIPRAVNCCLRPPAEASTAVYARRL